MIKLIEATKQSFSRLWFFHLAVLLIWLKTFIVQRYVFELPIKGWYQEIIDLISPLSAILLMVWLSLMIARKWKNTAILIISFLSSFILFANAWYYRFFHDFITLPILFQGKNASDLGNSAFELLQVTDVFYFTDFAILLAVVWIRHLPPISMRATEMSTLFVIAVICFIVNLGMAETVRPELLTRTFDRNILVKSIGTYNYHVYDFILSSKTKTQRAFATSDGLADVENYVKELPKTTIKQPEDLLGIAKGKNVVIISLESTQNFVINNTLFGQEITPFLNDLIKESYYFDNFYHQTGQGKTSDAEFIMDNSLYPLPSGAVYFTHSTNEFNSTPKILDKYGYYSASLHANDKSFWNRDNMYTNLGYDRFFSKPDYVITEDNSIGWGLKDIPFMEQSVEHLKSLPQPFYSRLLTLTNHHPFTLGKEDELIPEFDSGDGTVDRYFTTVRYTDEALKIFFQDMKKAGLYDNTIFILYGDHYGISPLHNDAMEKFLGKKITPYEQIQLQKVPLIIHIPGMTGGTISKVSGQIDVRPTLLGLLGIEGESPLDFGENLFAENPDPLIVLRDGTFITNKYIRSDSICYQKGYIPVEVDVSLCDTYKEQAENDLNYSDKIIYGDLMRFTDELKRIEDAELLSQYPHGPYGPGDPNAPIPLLPENLMIAESESEAESEAKQQSIEAWKLTLPPVAVDEAEVVAE
jgi:lipoteichoic acid synthase